MKTTAVSEAFGVRCEPHMSGFGNLQILGATSEDVCKYHERGLLAPGVDYDATPGFPRMPMTPWTRIGSLWCRPDRASVTTSCGTTSRSTVSLTLGWRLSTHESTHGDRQVGTQGGSEVPAGSGNHTVEVVRDPRDHGTTVTVHSR